MKTRLAALYATSVACFWGARAGALSAESWHCDIVATNVVHVCCTEKIHIHHGNVKNTRNIITLLSVCEMI